MPHSSTAPYPATSPTAAAASSSSSSHHRYPATQSTSSAFSASANPNEDWTKISDLAERRRIQNRIAQRNYRKKLKKRLEDLERRATSSASPEPREENEEVQARPERGYDASSMPYAAASPRSQPLGSHGPSHSYARQRPRSPSPPAAYAPYVNSYSPAAEYSSYPSTSSYSHYPSLSSDLSAYSSYPPAAPRTERRTSKSETFDEQMRSFNLNYTSAPAAYEPYPQTHRPSWHEAAGPQDLHTPPLSDTDFEICPPLEIEIDDGLFELQQSPAEFFGFQVQQPLTPPVEEQPPFFFL